MILIVDNDWFLREIYANTLFDLEPIQTAQDGLQAWRYVQTHHQDYHFILSDVHMPGMDGPELFASLNEIYTSPYPERWLMTGALHLKEELLTKEGVSGVLEKPISLDLLLKTAQNAISRFHHQKKL